MNSPPFSRFQPVLTTLLLAGLACYWLGIFVATHLPARSVPQVGGDKPVHLLAYLGLALLLTLAVLRCRPFRWRLLVYTLLAVALYGAFDELTQIPAGRQADFFDWLADLLGGVAGVTLAVAAYFSWQALQRPRKSTKGQGPSAKQLSIGKE